MSCTHRFTRVITEVDFGEANIDEQVLHANNPTFVAIFILSHDGHLSITNTLFRHRINKYSMHSIYDALSSLHLKNNTSLKCVKLVLTKQNCQIERK